MKYKRDLFTRCQSIGGEIYLAKNGKAFKLNEMGIKVWKALDGTIALEKIVDEVSNEFQVDKSVVKHDIDSFIKRLLERNLIFPLEGV